jgi:hypothetical protein
MTDVAVPAEAAWELALYRTLKWESAPHIRAITWVPGSDMLRLEVFCREGSFDTAWWSEMVEAEVEQCLIPGSPRFPRMRFNFRPAEDFHLENVGEEARAGVKVLHVNHWFGAA